MWTNFVACDASTTVKSEPSFRNKVLEYFRRQPGIAGLFRHLPADTLLRVYLDFDHSLHCHAVHVPLDAILFPEGSLISFKLGAAPAHLREDTGRYHWGDRGKAVAFFYTQDDTSLGAQPGETNLALLDFVQLPEMINTQRFMVAASFLLEPRDYLEIYEAPSKVIKNLQSDPS